MKEEISRHQLCFRWQCVVFIVRECIYILIEGTGKSLWRSATGSFLPFFYIYCKTKSDRVTKKVQITVIEL